MDVLIVALALEAMSELVVDRNSSSGPRSLWFALPAIGVLVLPLFWRRRYPFAAVAVYWVIGAAIACVDSQVVPSAESLFAIGLTTAFLLGNLRNALQAAIGLAVVVTSAVIIVERIPDHSASQLLFVPLDFAIGWVAGFALREHAERAEAAELRAALAEQERDAASRIAAAEERARIARELHDIVAHAVSVMVLQVGAVRHKLPNDFAEDREALQSVEQAGRTALVEMRRLLAAMRRDEDDVALGPEPGLESLESLFSDVERSGIAVRLHVDGEPFPLPRGLDLSAYRIVQEGLTNALKHAHASNVDVRLHYLPEELQIEVRDDGAGPVGNDGLGHGLVGVRERVKIYGGDMSAGAANDGGFVLATRLPLVGERG